MEYLRLDGERESKERKLEEVYIAPARAIIRHLTSSETA